MEMQPPVAVIVNVPGCVFNLDDFSNARAFNLNNEDLKIEFKKGSYVVVRDYSIESFNEALKASCPPAKIELPL